jgi:SAM-dependent methyltransferase
VTLIAQPVATIGPDGAVTCAWCGCPARPNDARLAICASCGAATTYPQPDDEELEGAYAHYRPSSGRFAGGGDRILAISRASLARRLDRIAPSGRILDVGSGDAALLKALRARGRGAVGLERVAGEDRVIARELVDFDEDMGAWAAVVFWHSLEHLREPSAALDRAVALLRPGGVLIIAVPNFASWQAHLFGRRWFHLDLPRHFVHLTASALESEVQRRGLAVERTLHWRSGQLVFGWLHGIVGALPGHVDLYSSIRRPEARDTDLGGRQRATALATASALVPLAVAMAAAEVVASAGGTVYLEARRP